MVASQFHLLQGKRKDFRMPISHLHQYAPKCIGAVIGSHYIRYFLMAALFLGALPNSDASTVAIWLFDDPTGSKTARDSSGNGFDLELGSGQIVPGGQFGSGLACPRNPSKFVARRMNVQGTRLGLGNHDWTVEWWQRRDSASQGGHVDWTYLLVDNAVNTKLAEKSWEMGFQTEARFSGFGLWADDREGIWSDGKPLYGNVFADKYDEVHRLSLIRDVDADFYAGRDTRFHHCAWVYDAQIKRLSYFEDGRGPFFVRDGAAVAPGNQFHAVYGMMGMGPLNEYPYTQDAYTDTGDVVLYIGGEDFIGPSPESGLGIKKIPEGYAFTPRARAGQTSSGMIDEIRVSEVVLYRQPFTPPTSFASDSATVSAPRLSTRRLILVASPSIKIPPAQTVELSDQGASKIHWRAQSSKPWLSVTPSEGELSDLPATIRIQADSGELWPSFHRAEVSVEFAGAPTQTIDVQLNVEQDDSVTWLFDESLDAPARCALEDQTDNGCDLILGPGGGIARGLFGNALDPRGGRKGQAAIRRYIDATHLNLGRSADWTIECWVQPTTRPKEGDVLFDLRERLRIGPYPYYTGIGPACGLEIGPDASSLRFFSEPSGVTNQLLKTDSEIWKDLSGKWHHVALVYQGADRRLTHWIDGVQQDSVLLPAALQPLSPSGENTMSVGKTVEGKRPVGGLIDEVRISGTAQFRYDQAKFDPPPSFAPSSGPIELACGPHLFIDDYYIDNAKALARVQHTPDYPVDKPPYWDEYMRDIGDSHTVDAGPDCDDPRRRYLRVNFHNSLSEASPVGGINLFSAPSIDGPWVSHEENPVIPYIWGGQPGYGHAVVDAYPMIYDADKGLYLLVAKTNSLLGENPDLTTYRDERFNYQNRVTPGFRREVGMAFSPDGVRWSTSQRILQPDDYDDGETQMQFMMVYKRGGLYLGHLCIHRDDIDRGAFWTVLTTSRDMFHWTRYREPFIPYNEDPTAGDKVFVPHNNGKLYIRGDHTYLAFTVQGSHKPPRRPYEGFARLKLDRFVSRRANGDEAGLLVMSLANLDNRIENLQINADVADEGEIRVQVRDRDDTIVPGFGLDDCQPVRGDKIRHSVRWGADRTIADLAGRQIQLEYSVRNADLYAFYLTGSDWMGDHDFTPKSNTGRVDLYTVAELLDLKPAPADTPIQVSPASLHFTLNKDPGLGYSGGTSEQALTISQVSGGTDWRLIESIPWLTVNRTEGKADEVSASITVRAMGRQLGRGTYLGKMSVALKKNSESPIEIPVTFKLESGRAGSIIGAPR